MAPTSAMQELSESGWARTWERPDLAFREGPSELFMGINFIHKSLSISRDWRGLSGLPPPPSRRCGDSLLISMPSIFAAGLDLRIWELQRPLSKWVLLKG